MTKERLACYRSPMRLNDKQKDRLSSIWEKVGLAILLGAGGDILVNRPGLPDLLIDLTGIVLGLAALVASVLVLREWKTER